MNARRRICVRRAREDRDGKIGRQSQAAPFRKAEKHHPETGAARIEVLSFPRRARHRPRAVRIHLHRPQRLRPERHHGSVLHHLQRRHQSRPQPRALDGVVLRPLRHGDGAQHPPLHRGVRGAGQEIRLQHLLLRHRLRRVHGGVQGRGSAHLRRRTARKRTSTATPPPSSPRWSPP